MLPYFLKCLSQKEKGKIYATFLLVRKFLEILFLLKGTQFPEI